MAPNIGKRCTVLCYIKTFIYVAIQTVTVICGICYPVTAYMVERHNIMSRRLFVFSLLFSYIAVALLTICSQVKNDKWQQLYRETRAFQNIKTQTSNNIFVDIALISYLAMGAFELYLFCESLGTVNFDENNSRYRSFVGYIAPWYFYYYHTCIASLMLLMINEVVEKVRAARNSLRPQYMNIYMAEDMFLTARRISKLCNDLFGYQLMVTFGQWLLYILELGLHAVVVANPRKLNSENVKIIVSLAILGIHVIMASVSKKNMYINNHVTFGLLLFPFCSKCLT